MIFVNFKLYHQAWGERAVALAKICQRVSQKTKVPVIPLVAGFDLWRVKKEVGDPVWAQHGDLYFHGPHTGWQSPALAAATGAAGILLNHSEHPLPPGQIRQILAYLRRERWQEKWAQELGEETAAKIKKLQVMVAFRTKGQVRRWLARLDPPPDFVAYEPRELIGSGRAVTEVQPAMIRRIRQLVPASWPLLVGAGIKTAADSQRARELGAAGILVSSAVVLSLEPEKVLLGLAAPWR